MADQKITLAEAVKVSKGLVQSQIKPLNAMVEDIKAIPVDQRTEPERQFLKIVNANKRSQPMINLATAVSVGKKKPGGLPQLAVASYKMSFAGEKVFVKVTKSGAVTYHGHGKDNWNISFPAGTLARFRSQEWVFDDRVFPMKAWAVVPIVPPELRQDNPNDVVVLFEVVAWKRLTPLRADPYLLKKVAGNIYAVIGTWDITERELRAYQTARDLGI